MPEARLGWRGLLCLLVLSGLTLGPGLGTATRLTYHEAFVAQGWEVRQSLVWLKDAMVLGHGDYHYRHEPILYGHVPSPGRYSRGLTKLGIT